MLQRGNLYAPNLSLRSDAGAWERVTMDTRQMKRGGQGALDIMAKLFRLNQKTNH